MANTGAALTAASFGFPAMEEQAGGQNNKTVEDKDLHAAQEPLDAPPGSYLLCLAQVSQAM